MGRVEFHEVSIGTRPGAVMTPRAATEQLVDRAAELIDDREARVADIGTGSGAIAIALALLAPRAEIWATDVSDEAVELAQTNVRSHELADRVHVLRGDLLDPVPHSLDLVVANLPYLPWQLRDHPDYSDLRGEPPSAVFAAGQGLDPYCRLLPQAEARLRDDGRLLIQYRARMLEAGRHELDELRRELGVGIPRAA
jgi:release factor glutamine methyltransferase